MSEATGPSLLTILLHYLKTQALNFKLDPTNPLPLSGLAVYGKTFHCPETQKQRDSFWHEAKIMDTNGIN